MTVAPVAPATLAEAEALMRDAAARAETVSFVGGETEYGFGYPPERVERLVATRGLTRVVEYAPDDLVVDVEAGLPLATLQATLAQNGQRLALDPPVPERSTIGGLLATNTYGPRRTRFGSLRDLIVGITLVRADGERVRGGGRVVKNVAGFDLPKISVGSLGTLGMIATATFRLHPLPQTARALRVASVPVDALRELIRSITRERLEPAALHAVATGGDAFDVHVLFEGFSSGVDEQYSRFAVLTAARATVEESSAEFSAADALARTHGELRLRIAVPPNRLDTLATDVLAPLRGALGESAVVVYPSLGIAFAGGAANAPNVATAVLAARSLAEAWGGNLVVLDAPPAFRAAVDVYGTPPPALGLMRALKTRFDPARRLNRGRFIGHL